MNGPVIRVEFLECEVHEKVASIWMENVTRHFDPILGYEEIAQRIQRPKLNHVQIKIITAEFVNC